MHDGESPQFDELPVLQGEGPIACTLNRAELVERGRLVNGLAARGLIRRKRAKELVELSFARDSDVRDELEALIELEHRCCPFLSFTLTDADAEVLLRVQAPQGADAVLDALYAATSSGGRELAI